MRIHPKSIEEFKKIIRKITNRNHSRNFEERLENLTKITRGWTDYFGIVDAGGVMNDLDMWTRRRLRTCLWKQRKRI